MQGFGVRPSGVRPGIRLDDGPIELLGEVEDVVLDPEPCGDPARVLDVADRTAPESPTPPQSFIVAPTTSWPASAKSAAATEESTPPERPTSTRTARTPRAASTGAAGAPARPAAAGPVPGDSATQPLHGQREGCEDPVYVGFGRRVAERETHVAPGLGLRAAHGDKDVARLDGSARTGRARRGAHPELVEDHQQLLGLDALDPEVADGIDAVSLGRGQPPPPGTASSTPETSRAARARTRRQTTSRSSAVALAAATMATMPARFWVPARRFVLLGPAVEKGPEARRSLAHDEGAHAFGAAELVGAQAQQVHLGRRRASEVNPGESLHGVGVHEGRGGPVMHEGGDIAKRLDARPSRC